MANVKGEIPGLENLIWENTMFRFRKLVIRLMNKIEKIPGIFLISALILNIIFFNWPGNLIFVSPPPLNSDDSVRKITYEINSSSNFQRGEN